MCVSLQCVILCVFLVLGAAAYDSQESHESLEVFMNPYQANTFIRSPPDPLLNQQLYRRMLAERRAEVCEDFTPCRLFSLRAGSDLAYQIYFGAQQPRLRPHLRRY